MGMSKEQWKYVMEGALIDCKRKKSIFVPEHPEED